MSLIKWLGVVAFAVGALGCGVGNESVDGASLADPSSSTEQALTACSAAAQGETRWVSVGCCSSTSKQQRKQICDAGYWRNTSSYRCYAVSSCAL